MTWPVHLIAGDSVSLTLDNGTRLAPLYATRSLTLQDADAQAIVRGDVVPDAMGLTWVEPSPPLPDLGPLGRQAARLLRWLRARGW